ncbi:MAG TPA: ABC transporter permease [Vicinamibacterales bacterium]|nr:ABC transporter permease [Vicinamibacterales bacterium]
MERALQDVRYAIRRLIKSPGFTLLTVAMIAVGVGVNTALFSAVNAVLFRPLQVERPSELVEIYTADAGGTPATSSYPDLEDIRAERATFAAVLAYSPTVVSMTADARTRMLYGEAVSGDYFQALGIRLVRGRAFTAEEAARGGPMAAVVSHAFWQKQLGGAEDVIGRTLSFNGRRVTVVGVAPGSFRGLLFGLAAEFWLPLSTEEQLMPRAAPAAASDAASTRPSSGSSDVRIGGGGTRLEGRGNRSLFIKARLARGVTPEQANARMAVVAARLGAAFPVTNKDRAITVRPTSDVRLHPEIDKVVKPFAALVLAFPMLVLLVVCANVAGLLLSRASARRREVAIRLAIGASRARLVRQLLTESIVLAFAGGAAGFAFAWLALRALVNIAPPMPVPIPIDLPLDARVLTFNAAAAMIAALAFGLAPAFQASRPDLVPALKGEATPLLRASRRFGLRSVLVVSQVAVSLVLLVAAGLFARSLQQAKDVPLGFERERLVIVMPGLVFTPASPAEVVTRQDALRDRLAVLPGVTAVALTDRVPLEASFSTRPFVPDGETYDERRTPEVDVTDVDAQYFRTFGIPILRGRGFTTHDDRDSARVAIVSEALAKRFWPGQDAVGRRFRFGDSTRTAIEVVGVARDTRVRTLGEEPRPYVYLSYLQHPDSKQIVLRTAGDPATLIPAIRREIQAFDADMPILALQTMPEHLGLMLYLPRAGAWMLGIFGALGLLLAAMGLYGVIASAVSQRTREIGIRMALGATPGDVLRVVMRDGMLLVCVGVAAGLLLAAFAAQPISSYLYGIKGLDPLAFGVQSLVLVAAAFTAMLAPAWRAIRVHPTVALRQE